VLLSSNYLIDLSVPFIKLYNPQESTEEENEDDSKKKNAKKTVSFISPLITLTYSSSNSITSQYQQRKGSKTKAPKAKKEPSTWKSVPQVYICSIWLRLFVKASALLNPQPQPSSSNYQSRSAASLPPYLVDRFMRGFSSLIGPCFDSRLLPLPRLMFLTKELLHLMDGVDPVRLQPFAFLLSF